MYPWPTGDFDNVMDVALDIAMNYLDLTGQAVMSVSYTHLTLPTKRIV